MVPAKKWIIQILYININHAHQDLAAQDMIQLLKTPCVEEVHQVMLVIYVMMIKIVIQALALVKNVQLLKKEMLAQHHINAIKELNVFQRSAKNT